MKKHYDAIVIGVGSMGAATLYHLAKSGMKVLGIDRFSVPHEHGSHTGQTRIIRKAYFEHPDYIPLLEKAYESWHDLEEATDEKLMHKVGLLYSGKSEGELLSGVRKSSEMYNVPIANWTHQELHDRFPQFSIPDDFDIIYEENAGFVLPEKTISLFTKIAVQNGADLMQDTEVIRWNREGNGYRVHTSEASISCDKVIVTAGAWASQLLPDLNIPLKVTLQPLAWMHQDNADFRSDRFPCFLFEVAYNSFYYGFPDLTSVDIPGPQGLKTALHTPGVDIDPDKPRPGISDLEKKRLVELAERFFPNADNKIAEAKSCLYTYAPDTHFIIDFLPGHDRNVIIATGFSGHGFKFCPGIGASISKMVLEGQKDSSLEFLGLDRFRQG